MAIRFPMICDSCLHKLPNRFACTAFPERIPLDPLGAELHDEPREDQINEIVYHVNSARMREKGYFDAFRAAMLRDQGR